MSLEKQLQMKRMYRTAYAILLNDADAADAIQEELPKLQHIEYFQMWYSRILINRCCDIRKRRNKEIPLESGFEPAAEGHYSLEWKGAESTRSYS